MDCPCKEDKDKDNVQALGEAIPEGLLTTQEADNIYHSRNIWGTYYHKWRDLCPTNYK